MKQFFKNYGFITSMLVGIAAGCVFGWLQPEQAGNLAWLGTIFTNLMFCVVVPMVFCSICSAIANMESMKKAGKIMGVTVATFCVTAGIAAIIMYVVCRIIPLVPESYKAVEGAVDEPLSLGEMVIGFFTKPDFYELLSRRAILPLIVFAVLFGFGVQMAGGKETPVAKLLASATDALMNMVKLVSYYAPIGFFGFFAYLVATYGPQLISDYSKTLLIYYVLSFVYMFAMFPVYARFGGGKGAVKVMFKNLFKPAAVSFGTCSSVATIPTNLEEAAQTGISKDVAEMVIPLGATINMDGTAIYQGVCAIFIAQIFGIDLTLSNQLTIILTATLASIGTAGVPGSGMIMLAMVLESVGLPVEGIALVAGIDRILDMGRTTVNITGDAVVTTIVAHQNESLDKNVFNSTEVQENVPELTL